MFNVGEGFLKKKRYFFYKEKQKVVSLIGFGSGSKYSPKWLNVFVTEHEMLRLKQSQVCH